MLLFLTCMHDISCMPEQESLSLVQPGMTPLWLYPAGQHRRHRDREVTQARRWCKNQLQEKYLLGNSSPSQRSKYQWMKFKNSALSWCLFGFYTANKRYTKMSTNKFECIISIPEEMQCLLAWELKLDLLKIRSGEGYPLAVCHRLLNLLLWSSCQTANLELDGLPLWSARVIPAQPQAERQQPWATSL